MKLIQLCAKEISQVILERQYHSPVIRHTDKQSPWRGAVGDNKSFGGVNMKSKREINSSKASKPNHL